MMLTTNAQLVADVLGAEEQSPDQVIRAVAATRSLDLIVEDTLQALVDQARAEGHTWAEIGSVFRVSRQAAFQRFGGGGRRSWGESGSAGPEPGGTATPVEGAVEHAAPVLEAFLEGRWQDARATFDQRMLRACSAELLADVREKVRREAGEVQALGTPVVSTRDGYTIVDIPVALERADAVGRVALDADRQVAGFFIRPREAMT